MELGDYRKEMNEINMEILALFVRRMELSEKIALFKKENGLNIFDPEREAEITRTVRAAAGEKNADEAEILFKTLTDLSKKRQAEIVG